MAGGCAAVLSEELRYVLWNFLSLSFFTRTCDCVGADLGFSLFYLHEHLAQSTARCDFWGVKHTYLDLVARY